MKSRNSAGSNPHRTTKPDNSGASKIRGLECRLVATTLLTRVFDDGRNLDALCDRQHGMRQFLALNEKDRALARAIAITALRHRNRIAAIMNRLMDRPPPKNARFLIHSLHVAATQILFMDIPESAAVNLAVGAIKRDKRTIRFASLANAILRRMARETSELKKQTEAISPFPDWFSKLLRTDYGKHNAERIAASVGQSAGLDISVKSDPEVWAVNLEGFVLPTGSVRTSTPTPVHELPGFKEGQWWVQDAAAALPARLIQADAGSRVLDLCAAPGGKTAQLANAGYDVTALDISGSRLSRLHENLGRVDLRVKTVCADILEWQPEELFDAVLIDTPCSSTGTIRRHPDVLWAKSAEDIDALAELQFNLVKRSAGFVRPGGCLVFANCSMLKNEGENLLNRIIESCPELEMSRVSSAEISGLDGLINGQGALRSLPYHFMNDDYPELSGLDGFFACRFIRK